MRLQREARTPAERKPRIRVPGPHAWTNGDIYFFVGLMVAMTFGASAVVVFVARLIYGS